MQVVGNVYQCAGEQTMDYLLFVVTFLIVKIKSNRDLRYTVVLLCPFETYSNIGFLFTLFLGSIRLCWVLARRPVFPYLVPCNAHGLNIFVLITEEGNRLAKID